jgi:hypothetical protein
VATDEKVRQQWGMEQNKQQLHCSEQSKALIANSEKAKRLLGATEDNDEPISPAVAIAEIQVIHIPAQSASLPRSLRAAGIGSCCASTWGGRRPNPLLYKGARDTQTN